jgi:hypothetical protein
MTVHGPSLDHDHETKHTRGALCRHCNLGLGCFKDNPALFESAISYLQADYSGNPPHPEDPYESKIGLVARDFDYQTWFRTHQLPSHSLQ